MVEWLMHHQEQALTHAVAVCVGFVLCLLVVRSRGPAKSEGALPASTEVPKPNEASKPVVFESDEEEEGEAKVSRQPTLPQSRPPSRRLDDRLLEEFMRGFYGYGIHEAPFWLIGMEEGGGKTLENIEQRLMKWRDAGKPLLMNLPSRKGISPTWGRLIRVVLAARGENPSTDRVREYQTSTFGKPHGETCLMELLPLPSPKKTVWLYPDFSELPHLKSRSLYEETTAPWRTNALRSLLGKHKPSVVVFYGYEHLDDWRRIAGVDFDRDDERGFGVATANGTLFISMPHPTYVGLSSEYFASIGQFISSRLSGSKEYTHSEPL